jgi:hypothetical protein
MVSSAGCHDSEILEGCDRGERTSREGEIIETKRFFHLPVALVGN